MRVHRQIRGPRRSCYAACPLRGARCSPIFSGDSCGSCALVLSATGSGRSPTPSTGAELDGAGRSPRSFSLDYRAQFASASSRSSGLFDSQGGRLRTVATDDDRVRRCRDRPRRFPAAIGICASSDDADGSDDAIPCLLNRRGAVPGVPPDTGSCAPPFAHPHLRDSVRQPMMPLGRHVWARTART